LFLFLSNVRYLTVLVKYFYKMYILLNAYYAKKNVWFSLNQKLIQNDLYKTTT